MSRRALARLAVPAVVRAPRVAPAAEWVGPFSLIIEGEPVPKARARVVNGHSFTPERTREAEARIAQLAKVAGARAVEGEIAVGLTFYRSNRRRVDVDNLAKTVLDALNGVAFGDDSQITCLTVLKKIDPKRPRTELVITRAVQS